MANGPSPGVLDDGAETISARPPLERAPPEVSARGVLSVFQKKPVTKAQAPQAELVVADMQT